jgi:hypothetical protein
VADIYLRRKPNGKPDSYYFRRARLRTKNANEARDRARLVQEGKWDGKGEPPSGKDAAKVTAAAFAIAPPVPEPPPAPAAPPPEPPPAPAPEPVTGDWTHAATGAAAETAPPAAGPIPEEPSSEQLAELLVVAELKVIEIYTQQTVYEPFIAPTIAEDGQKILIGAYKQMIDYGGAAIQLPPWVKGLVVPALTVVVSSIAIVGGFRDEALKQKAKAQGGA